MDPITAVGLASSVVQLGDTAFKIIKILDTIKEGGRERQRLCDEITVLWMILRNLRVKFEQLPAEQNSAWAQPLATLVEPNGVFEQIDQALKDVLSKLTESDSKLGKFKQTLRWPLDQACVDKTVARIERLKHSVTLVMGQTNIALAQEIRRGVLAIQNTVEDCRMMEILEWTCPLNFRQRQENLTPTPGTGGWFFKQDEFKDWHTGEYRWLWCHGIPGAGKTYLTSTAIDELRRLHKNENVAILMAFCSFDTVDSQSVDHLVAALLKQAIQIRRTIPFDLETLYRKRSTENKRPDLSTLCQILGKLLMTFEKTYIVLDALDELLDDAKRQRLLETFHCLSGSPKIMVTSRKLEIIGKKFEHPYTTGSYVLCDECGKGPLDTYYHCEHCVEFDLCEDCPHRERHGHTFSHRFRSLQVQITAQSGDITSYIARRVDMEDDLQQIVKARPALRTQIIETVVANAGEMFLLARFHMDALADCLTPGEISDALQRLPSGIDGTYDQAMERISKLSPNRKRAVKRLLQWVTYAVRPLKVKELEHSTAISRGVRKLPKDHMLNARGLTSLSAGIVIIDENENVRLTYKTAEGYFLERRETFFPNGDTELAECCIAYLELDAFNDGPYSGLNESTNFNKRLKQYPFLEYAALNWGYHAERGSLDIITPQALMFLRDEAHLEASVQAFWYVDKESVDSWDVRGGIGALHIAAYFGLCQIVIALLEAGCDPDHQDSRGATPMIYAAWRGHADVISSLLQYGATASIMDKRGSTALLRAARFNHQDVVRRLIQESDVAINARYASRNNFTALMLACEFDYIGIVELLLERPDIDVNQDGPTRRPWNPLLTATNSGRVKCVELLLQHSAIEVDHRDCEGYTAFMHAAKNGNAKLVEMLLLAGANTEMGDSWGGRALHRAIDNNRYAVVKFLIDKGVQSDFKDNLGRTLLHAATLNDLAPLLWLLLDKCKGINVNAQGSAGETALHDAARYGYIDCAKALLGAGARTDIKDNVGHTPVRVAKDANKQEVLELLRGAREKEEVSRRKLEGEAEIKPVHKADTFNTNAELSIIESVTQNDAVTFQARILRATVEEVNAPGTHFQETPLHLASRYGECEHVRILLEAGASVDPVNFFQLTPLAMACRNRNLEIIKLLVQHGASVNPCRPDTRPLWETAIQNECPKGGVFLLAQPTITIEGSDLELGKALGWAARFGNLAVCKKLVDAGAPILLKNSKGVTPIQIANGFKQEKVEQYLLEEATKLKLPIAPAETPPPIEKTNTGETVGDAPTKVATPVERVDSSEAESGDTQVEDEPDLTKERSPSPGVNVEASKAAEHPAIPRQTLVLSILILILLAMLFQQRLVKSNPST